MDDRDKIAWLYRRVGFGLAPGQLDALVVQGVDAALDGLVDPDAAGIPDAPDPWLSGTTGPLAGDAMPKAFAGVVADWLGAMVTSPRPFEEWMRWFWHGHFVVTARVVPFPALVVDYLRVLGTRGLGDFRTLLHAVTLDPAMLIYLDGDENTVQGINENYGRELLELFSLGIGNYTEADVRAGATALTGHRVLERGTAPRRAFVPALHDDSPQRYLHQVGVHDVDSVVDAIVAHEANAPFITRRLATAILGPGVDDGIIRRLSSDFAASGLQVRLARRILEAGLDGAGGPVLRAPVPWLVAMLKATGAPLTATLQAAAWNGLAAAGQMPLDAPNVGGWPGGEAWLSASTVVARCTMAADVAAATPSDSLVRRLALAGDTDGLAVALGHPSGFSPSTAHGIRSIPEGERSRTVERANAALTVAMASPETAFA